MPGKVKERVLETYRQTHDSYDEGVSERLGSSRWGIESLTKLLLRDIPKPESPVALDVACGTGLSTFVLHDYLGGEVHGVDLSPEMVDKARENTESLGLDIEFKEGDVENLPYPDDKFNTITSNMSFHFFPDKLMALKEMGRVLAPGGRMGHLYGGDSHLSELIQVCLDVSENRPEYNGFRESVQDIVGLHIDLEKTQRLIWEAGLRKPLVYGYHRVMTVKPEAFWFTNPYPGYWRSAAPEELRGKLDEEVVALMKERSGPRGFKITWYTIHAYASKPVK
jgi:ubiquinone/menaquinone biosynthesis C-methylase UbiE